MFFFFHSLLPKRCSPSQPNESSRSRGPLTLSLIGTCLLEDWERGAGTVLFHPTASDDRQSKRNSVPGARNGDHRKTNGDAGHRREDRDSPSSLISPQQIQQASVRTQTISIPSDMVGCIIGKNGIKITEIRRLSRSKNRPKSKGSAFTQRLLAQRKVILGSRVRSFMMSRRRSIDQLQSGQRTLSKNGSHSPHRSSEFPPLFSESWDHLDSFSHEDQEDVGTDEH